MVHVWSTPACCTVIWPRATTPFWNPAMEVSSSALGSVTCKARAGSTRRRNESAAKQCEYFSSHSAHHERVSR